MSNHKGSNAERELIHQIHALGWSSVRIAGSGSSRYPSPDILAGNAIRRLAIECKCTSSQNKYIPKHEIEQLHEFSRMFGAEAWLGIRFSRTEWFFLIAEDCKETKESFVITKEIVRLKGVTLEELLNY